jgi:hypothetical protein
VSFVREQATNRMKNRTTTEMLQSLAPHRQTVRQMFFPAALPHGRMMLRHPQFNR